MLFRSGCLSFKVCHAVSQSAKPCPVSRTVIGSSTRMLEILADVLAACTQSSGGLPPLGCAFDGSTANVKILKFFVGTLPRSEWQEIPFLKDCVVHFPDYKFWPFGHVSHSGHLMVSFHGFWHLQKRLSLQYMSGARKVRFGSLFVDLASTLKQKLPVRAYVCQDAQSDMDAIMRLSPPFLTRTWTGLGRHVPGLVAALLASATSASLGFSKSEQALSAFGAFYVLLLRVVFNEDQKRPKCETLHPTTVRHACALASCAVTACLTSHEARNLQERCIEEFFARIKQPFRGSAVCQL